MLEPRKECRPGHRPRAETAEKEAVTLGAETEFLASDERQQRQYRATSHHEEARPDEHGSQGGLVAHVSQARPHRPWQAFLKPGCGGQTPPTVRRRTVRRGKRARLSGTARRPPWGRGRTRLSPGRW